jgi:hypothetical protein
MDAKTLSSKLAFKPVSHALKICNADRATKHEHITVGGKISQPFLMIMSS